MWRFCQDPMPSKSREDGRHAAPMRATADALTNHQLATTITRAARTRPLLAHPANPKVQTIDTKDSK